MLVLHTIWDMERLNIWAESSTRPLAASADSRRRKKDAPQRHPFALPGDDLSGQLPEIFRRSSPIIASLNLRLPTTKNGPAPSPWLLLEDRVSQNATGLENWAVDALAFEPGPAFDLLTDLPAHAPQGTAFSSSIRFWSDLALFALELLAKEKFVPAIEAGVALWTTVIEGIDSDRLRSFSKAMPPSCRSFMSGDIEAISPGDLVKSFIDSTADSFIRRSLRSAQLLPKRRGRRPKVTPLAEQFICALTSEEPRLTAPSDELASFSERIKSWLSQLQPEEDTPYRTCLRLEPPGEESDAWIVRFFLQARDDRSLLVPAEDVWRTKSESLKFLKKRLKNPQEQLLADLGKAMRVFPQMEKCLQLARPAGMVLDDDEAYSFLRESAPLLEQDGFGVILPQWWDHPVTRLGMKLRLKSDLKVERADGKSLFGLDSLVNYDWELALGDRILTEAEFSELAGLKVPLVRMKGEWMVLRPEEVEAAIEFFKRRRPQGEMTLGEALRIALQSEISEPGPGAKPGLPVTGVETDSRLEEMRRALSRPEGRIEPIGTPQGFKGILRPYQGRGVSWLEYLRGLGFGACLADDMGLGKTIELIAFLLHERECQKGVGPAPALLISPLSVAGNWQKEIERFAPSLKVMVHHGADRLSGTALQEEALKRDVVITTYALAQRDADDLSALRWSHIVLDEAQNIKNPYARQTQAIKSLKTVHRVALTGTPVENRLSELWSIMDFLNPGYLGSSQAFRKEFVLPIEKYRDKGRSEKLREIIQPFVLRRLKTDPSIINDLPEKTEMKVNYNLTPEQASLYAAVVSEMLEKIEASEGIERKGQILSALTKLKQICNHPALLLQDGSPLEGRSGKLIRLEEMLYEALAEGDKALIFTQFAGMGAMLRGYLQEKLGYEVLFLYGGTPKKKRDAMIQSFQSGGSSLFILSLKAGGTGLNLTAANHVFHFDRWWNPAVENQATDRVFRIGQKKNVFVHKFVCLGTLEERIDQMIEEKKALAESVIGSGESWLTELSNQELKDIISLRSEAVIKGGEGE